MKTCPHCGSQLEDTAAFCTNCGATATGEPQVQEYPVQNTYDHTPEFTAEDVSQNKVLCMLVYLSGVVGIIVALLAAGGSPYVAFHVRQELKMSVLTILLGIAAAVLAITVIVPLAALVGIVVIFVLRVIAFFQVCQGRAVEPALIRELGFMK